MLTQIICFMKNSCIFLSSLQSGLVFQFCKSLIYGLTEDSRILVSASTFSLLQYVVLVEEYEENTASPSSKSLQIINSAEGVEKKEPSYTFGGNVNWCSHYGEQYEGSLKS